MGKQYVCIVTDTSAVCQEYLYRSCNLCVFHVNAHATNYKSMNIMFILVNIKNHFTCISN